MAWQQNFVILRNGQRIRYALFEKPESPAYYVRFKGKDGRYMKPSTGHSRKVDAINAAHQIILDHYEEVAPALEFVTWDVAKEKLTEAMLADNKRPKTVKGYMETLNRLIEMFPKTRGPGDMSEFLALEFKVKYANGTFRRKKRQDDAEAFARKTKSLDSRLRTLKAVFSWFVDMRLLAGNPFDKIEQPEMDRHEVKYVKPEDVTEFLAWLEERYPGWRMPHLFFTVKAVTGCRLDDICNLRSEQLTEGRLVFTADTTKNRSERYAILPPELYAELDAYKGEEYLWERYPAELIEANRKNGFPVHRQKSDFAPRRLYLWVVQIMQYYQKATGRDLSSHDFRRAAFTRAAEADIHPKRAAVAFDVTAETMLRYYTATEKKRTADEVLSELQGQLMPKKKSAVAQEEE
ncbi:MAG TPA: site-specific integrase [Gemmataceae bacterium]|jgi:integrase